jgi:hypothetical protein
MRRGPFYGYPQGIPKYAKNRMPLLVECCGFQWRAEYAQETFTGNLVRS